MESIDKIDKIDKIEQFYSDVLLSFSRAINLPKTKLPLDVSSGVATGQWIVEIRRLGTRSHRNRDIGRGRIALSQLPVKMER